MMAGKADGRFDSHDNSYLVLLSMTGLRDVKHIIKTRITDPMGMTHTFLPPDNDTTLPDPKSESRLSKLCQADIIAVGGNTAIGTDLTNWNASYGQGGGGMISTIEELGLWAKKPEW